MNQLLFVDSDFAFINNISIQISQTNPNYVIDYSNNLVDAMQKINTGANLYIAIIINATHFLNEQGDILQVIENIKKVAPFTKIIVSLDQNDPNVMVELNSLKINFLIKPYSTDSLFAFIGKVQQIPNNIPKQHPSIGMFNQMQFEEQFKSKELKIGHLEDMGMFNGEVSQFNPEENSLQGGMNIDMNNNQNMYGNVPPNMQGGYYPQGMNGMPPQHMNNPMGNPQGMGGQMPPQNNMNGMNHMNMGIPPQDMNNMGVMNMPPQDMNTPMGNPQGMNGQMPPQHMSNPMGNPQGMNGIPPQHMNNSMGNPQGMGGQMPPQHMNNPMSNPQGMNGQMPPQHMNNPMGNPMGNPQGMNGMVGMPPQPMSNPMGMNSGCKTIAVHCPKGGVGKSSISKELSMIYSHSQVNGQKLRVCLIDMDLDYGDIGVMLELKQNKSIADWGRNIRQKLTPGQTHIDYSFEEIDKFYLLTHKSGLKVLAAPTNHRDALQITDDIVKIILDNLKKYFDVIIIDTGNNPKDYTIVSLQLADHMLMIGNLDTSTINEMLTLRKTLEQIQFPLNKIGLLMNEIRKEEENNARTIADYMKLNLIGILPRISQIERANNFGQTLANDNNNPFTKELKRVANTFVPIGISSGGPQGSGNGSQDGKKKSLFGFLKK